MAISHDRVLFTLNNLIVQFSDRFPGRKAVLAIAKANLGVLAAHVNCKMRFHLLHVECFNCYVVRQSRCWLDKYTTHGMTAVLAFDRKSGQFLVGSL